MEKDKISQQKKAYFKKTMFFSTLSFIALYFLILGVTQGFSEKLFWMAVITGAVWGLAMYFTMPFLMKKTGRWLEKKVPDPVLESGEQIEMSVPANYFRSKRLADGGKLFLTNQRLIFTAHKLNFNKSEVLIDLQDIQSAEVVKVANAVENGLRVLLKGAETRDFVVDNADEWAAVIQEKIN